MDFPDIDPLPVNTNPFISVKPEMSFIGSAESEPFSVYLAKEVPKMLSVTILPSPTNSKEIPPLLQAMEWHLHLKEYIIDRPKI